MITDTHLLASDLPAEVVAALACPPWCRAAHDTSDRAIMQNGVIELEHRSFDFHVDDGSPRVHATQHIRWDFRGAVEDDGLRLHVEPSMHGFTQSEATQLAAAMNTLLLHVGGAA